MTTLMICSVPVDASFYAESIFGFLFSDQNISASFPIPSGLFCQRQIQNSLAHSRLSLDHLSLII